MSGPTERELNELMARLADGDRTAFEPLFAALHPRAVALGRLRLGASDADDAAQEALVRVFARASEFIAGRAALPWFYTVAANEIHAVARRRARDRSRQAQVPAAEQLATTDDPESAALQAEMQASVRAAIESLDEDAAHAIRSLLGEESRPDPMPPALRKRVSRAYARLRVILGGRS